MRRNRAEQRLDQQLDQLNCTTSNNNAYSNIHQFMWLQLSPVAFRTNDIEFMYVKLDASYATDKMAPTKRSRHH